MNRMLSQDIHVPGDIEPEPLENIQQRRVNTVLDEKLTMHGIARTIKGLNDRKTQGGDAIPVEIWKYRDSICPTDCIK